MMFALVVAITVGVVYIISLIPLVSNIAGIKAEARFQVSQDDRGTALAAFLGSYNSTCGGYAEVLADQTAEGVGPNLDVCLRDTLKRMNPDGRVAVYFGGVLKKDYNDVGENHLLAADLALPGLKKGEVRVA